MVHQSDRTQDQSAKVDMTHALINAGILPFNWHPRLNQAPETLASDNLPDKVAGMLLGLAIGDALGNTSESLLPGERRRQHGWITDYRPNWYAENRPVGLPSDDTQLAFWTLEHLLEQGALDSPALGHLFASRRIFGLGQSVRQFLRDFKAGTDWTQAGARSAGNGALMRIAPILLPHLRNPSADLWADTLLAAHLTHRDALSNIACLAFIDLLWQWLAAQQPPDTRAWLDRFTAFCADVDPGVSYAPRAGHPPNFNGNLPALIEQYLHPALERGLSVTEAGEIWHSGAYLLETLPCVLFILARYQDDPEQAILAAVNETKDNDTIAAIVGAAVGALHGRSGLPDRWIDGLLGRTQADDDGRVFELIEQAINRYSAV